MTNRSSRSPRTVELQRIVAEAVLRARTMNQNISTKDIADSYKVVDNRERTVISQELTRLAKRGDIKLITPERKQYRLYYCGSSHIPLPTASPSRARDAAVTPFVDRRGLVLRRAILDTRGDIQHLTNMMEFIYRELGGK